MTSCEYSMLTTQDYSVSQDYSVQSLRSSCASMCSIGSSKCQLYSRTSMFCTKLKNFDLYLAMKLTGDTFNRFVDHLQQNRIISPVASTEIRRSRTDSDKWRRLVKVLETCGDESYPTFCTSLRGFKQSDLAQILEGEAVLRMKVSCKSIACLSTVERNLVKVLNFVLRYTGPVRESVRKLLMRLEEIDVRILEAKSDSKSGVIFWMWCRSVEGVRQLENLVKSGKVLALLSDLFVHVQYDILVPIKVHMERTKSGSGSSCDFSSRKSGSTGVSTSISGTQSSDMSSKSNSTISLHRISNKQTSSNSECCRPVGALTCEPNGGLTVEPAGQPTDEPTKKTTEKPTGESIRIRLANQDPEPTSMIGSNFADFSNIQCTRSDSLERFDCPTCFYSMLAQHDKRCPECRTKVDPMLMSGHSSVSGHSFEILLPESVKDSINSKESNISEGGDVIDFPSLSQAQCGLIGVNQAVDAAASFTDNSILVLTEEQHASMDSKGFSEMAETEIAEKP